MKSQVFTLEGNVGRRQLEAERKKLEAAAAAAEAKADMFARARAPLTGKSHGVQQRELFGGDLFTNPRRKQKLARRKRRVSRRPRHKRRAGPSGSSHRRNRRAAPRAVFHAFAHDRRFDIYRLTASGAKLVARNVRSSALKTWAKKQGATIKSGRRAQ